MNTVQVKCKCCKTEFTARVADRKRGWARFCSKSCKARKQFEEIGYPVLRENTDDWSPIFSSEALGQK